VTAHETTARILSGDETNRDVPFDVRTGEQTVGDVPRGVTGPIDFTVVPDEDAEPGVYQVPIRLEYRNVYNAEDDNGATLPRRARRDRDRGRRRRDNRPRAVRGHRRRRRGPPATPASST